MAAMIKYGWLIALFATVVVMGGMLLVLNILFGAPHIGPDLNDQQPVWQTLRPLPDETPSKVCVIDEHGACKIDITAEYANASADNGRECGPLDRYYDTTRYLCVRNITPTLDKNELARGADWDVETYFTQIDGNRYIAASSIIPDIKVNHLYAIHAQTQAGYCHGFGKITSVTEVASSCDGGSDCQGIPMGWTAGNRSEVCG